ncbi:MAG: YdeI/OmpD-associated family protein [Anaerolineae bacterium]|nr:YdeI/OmpD-associated family protein [Anaerolineae bacterium]
MADDKLNPSVDGYIRKNKQWQAEFKKLRAILLDFPLKEEIKWMHPCYTVDGGNIVLMQEFKEYCALLFPKGALLKDADGVLVAMTENTQAARQIRFTDVQQVVDLEPTIRAYVQEAINVEEAGLEVEFKDTADYEFPDEFQSRLEEDADLQVAFEALTPGRQRGYLLYFSGAKQSKTRASRVEKCIPKILEGKGLNDR